MKKVRKLPIEVCIQAWLEGSTSEKVVWRLREWLGLSERNMDSFIDQVDIHTALHEECLSDEADASWDIESLDVYSERKPGGIWHWLAAAVVFIILSGIILHYGGFLGGEKLVVAGTFQGVELVRNGELVSMRKGEGLIPGDVVKTAAGGSAVLFFDNGKTELRLKENSQLQLLQTKSGKKLQLLSGKMIASVMPQKDGNNLKINTPQAQMTVIGTKFTLKTDKTETALLVSEGKIHFSSLHTKLSVMVISGEYAAINAGGTRIEVGTVKIEK